MPLQLDAARMERLRGWFLKPAYTVSALLQYDPQQAANPFATFRDLPVDSRYRSTDTLGELYAAVRGRLAPVRAPALDWKGKLGLSEADAAQLRRLSEVRGNAAAQRPELSLLLLTRPSGSLHIVSLVRNSAHSNVAQIFDEGARRLPGEDTLLAIDGVAGAYPNALFAVDSEKLPDFVDAVARLDDDAVLLVRLTDRFGIRRSAPGEAAILDYSRLENR